MRFLLFASLWVACDAHDPILTPEADLAASNDALTTLTVTVDGAEAAQVHLGGLADDVLDLVIADVADVAGQLDEGAGVPLTITWIDADGRPLALGAPHVDASRIDDAVDLVRLSATLGTVAAAPEPGAEKDLSCFCAHDPYGGEVCCCGWFRVTCRNIHY